MRKPSVANALQFDLVRHARRKSVERRVEEAWALGRAMVAAYASAHHVGRARAMEEIARLRAAGRRPSRAADPAR